MEVRRHSKNNLRNGEENAISGVDSETLLEGSWLDWLPLTAV